LSTTNGTFQFTVNQVTLSPLSSPLTVSFSSGSASAKADITVLPGPPEKIVLNALSTAITAGQGVTFSGQVMSVAGTPVAQGTDVGISDVSDAQDAFPVTLQTNQSGSFSTSSVVMALAGQQTVDAGVTENGQTVSAQVTVNVSPGAPAKVGNLEVNPNPVFQGADATVTGTVTDQYANPIPGASVTLNCGAFASPYTVQTARDGSFNQEAMFTSSGTQTLSVEYDGQILATLQVNVDERGAYTVTPQASQNVTAGQTVSVSFVVTNSQGSPVVGVPVTFSAAPSGTTSLSETSGITDQNGEVSLEVTPDASGVTSITAEVAGCGGTAKLNVSAAAPYQITSIQVAPSFVQVNPSQSDWPVVSGQVLDQYGNPVGGADITVSGGYGPQAAGTTNANGVFNVNVDPTNVGGPYYVTVQASDSLGSVSAASGTGLTVVQYPPATMEISLVNPGQTIYTGQLIPVYCTLYNQNMQLWNDATVEFVTVTDQAAQISNLTPSGPVGNGTGSLQQNTGTYGNGEAAVNVNFDQSGSQTVLAELYINGNFTGTVAALTVTVLPGAVAQIVWSPVQPGTTVTAGTTLTLSGVALNSLGNPVPGGTEILVQLAGTNSQTTYTTTGGRFQVNLSPTSKGSFWLQAVASGQTFNGALVTIEPGPITYASPWGLNGSSNVSGTTINGIQHYTLDTPIPPGDNGITWSVVDQYWNTENDVPDNITISCTALSGGPAPFSSVQAPNPTGQQATINTPGYYFPAGQYQFTVTNNTTGKILSYYTITVANNALQPYEITDVTLTFGGNTYGPYYPNTPQYTNGTLSIPAGTTVTMSGELVTQSGQPVPNWQWIFYAWEGTGSGESAVATDQNGRFTVSSTPFEAGSGSYWFNMWASTGSQSFNQPFNVTPAPVNQRGQITVTVNPPVIGEQSWYTEGISFNVHVAAFDQYGNPVSGTATLSTPVPAPNGSSPQVFSAGLSNGQATFSGIQNNVDANGNYPITVTVTDQYGDTLSKTAYITIN
jgi:protocatechuate 3,4-dioxygenase beta subunit